MGFSQRLINPMKFDVAITSYKRPALVKDAVISCLNQGPLLNKVIVLDDASGDNTAEVIHSINDPRIVFAQRSENGGIAAARRDAFALSDADWLISLDSDHELLPGAIEGMAELLTSAEESVDILGARYQWDTGGVTPINIPKGIIGYRERILLSARKDGIGADYLCAVSKRIRQTVRWEPLRTIFPDTLFQLDIAKTGKTIFTPEILAIEKSEAGHGWTRGSAEQRWDRRCQDAPDGIKVLELILNRHEPGLKLWGKSILAGLYRQSAFYALLCGQRVQARQCVVNSIMVGGLSVHVMGLTILSMLPRKTLKDIYLLRG
jgi:glycosyltransferase involved in cell wall biosynthesis